MADEGNGSLVIAVFNIATLVQHDKFLQFPVSGTMSSSPYHAAKMMQCLEVLSFSIVFDELPRDIVKAW